MPTFPVFTSYFLPSATERKDKIKRAERIIVRYICPYSALS